MGIVLDAMGGDNAPMAPVEGAVQAAEKLGVEVVLSGKPEEIMACLNKLGHQEVPKGIEILPASQVITMEDNPARAFKEKKDSSMTVGLQKLKDGEADAFVSAG